MRKLLYLFLLPLAMAAAGCGGKKSPSDGRSPWAMMDSVDDRGLQRMQASESETKFEFKGKSYRSLVSRTPDESLPLVSSEAGVACIDNKIALRLTCGSETVLNRTFTKKDFSAAVDAEFLAKSILEGIVYDKTTPQGIVYAASVCYPQTDLYVPLSITITADGKTTIRKAEMFEEDYNDENRR